MHEVNYAAANIARETAGPNVSVAGKLGPSGKMLVMGEVTADELRDAFAEQAKALTEGGADFFHLETMADLSEVVAAVEGARSVSKLPIARDDVVRHGQAGGRPANDDGRDAGATGGEGR